MNYPEKDKALKPSEADVKLAIRRILADTKCWRTSLNYAIEYCKAVEGMTGEALHWQVLYILSNISYWRSPGSKEVRSTLKAFVK